MHKLSSLARQLSAQLGWAAQLGQDCTCLGAPHLNVPSARARPAPSLRGARVPSPLSTYTHPFAHHLLWGWPLGTQTLPQPGHPNFKSSHPQEVTGAPFSPVTGSHRSRGGGAFSETHTRMCAHTPRRACACPFIPTGIYAHAIQTAMYSAHGTTHPVAVCLYCFKCVFPIRLASGQVFATCSAGDSRGSRHYHRS